MKIHKLLGLLILSALMALAACRPSDTSEDIPRLGPSTPQGENSVGQAATPRPVITRIVTITPRPTIPNTPMPTLSDELMAYQGTWNLLLRYELSGLPELQGATLVYSSTAPVMVDLGGNVSGGSDMDANLQSVNCGTDRIDTSSLTYSLAGSLQSTGGGVSLRLLLLATDPESQEQYLLRCVDEAGAETLSEIQAPLLFPALLAGNLLEMRFDLAAFYERQELEIDLSEVSGGQLAGTLKAELYIGR